MPWETMYATTALARAAERQAIMFGTVCVAGHGELETRARTQDVDDAVDDRGCARSKIGIVDFEIDALADDTAAVHVGGGSADFGRWSRAACDRTRVRARCRRLRRVRGWLCR